MTARRRENTQKNKGFLGKETSKEIQKSKETKKIRFLLTGTDNSSQLVLELWRYAPRKGHREVEGAMSGSGLLVLRYSYDASFESGLSTGAISMGPRAGFPKRSQKWHFLDFLFWGGGLCRESGGGCNTKTVNSISKPVRNKHKEIAGK